MTYTEAAEHNRSLEHSMAVFRDPKKPADGLHERWVVLDDTVVAHLMGSSVTQDKVLVGVPLQSLKNDFRLCVREITFEEWHRAVARAREYQK